MTVVLIREEKPCEDEDKWEKMKRDWSFVTMSQGIPRVTRNWKRQATMLP